MRELCRTFGLSEDLQEVSSVLQRAFLVAFSRQSDIVCVCVGTSKVTGDCFGTIVGDLLLNAELPLWVYGSSHSNVDAHNIGATLEVVNLVHPNSFVFVVDAMSTLDPTTVGDVVLGDQYVGLNQGIKIFADLFVYGVTTYLTHAKRNLNSKLSITNKLAQNVCQAISSALKTAQHRAQLAFLEKLVLG